MMLKRAASTTVLILLLSIFPTFFINIQPAKAAGTIYIRADGSVDPPDPRIQRTGDTYTFTDNINNPIIVQRNGIIIDGTGHTLQGGGSDTGIDLSGLTGVTVRNMIISAFDYGIYLASTDHVTVTSTTVTGSTLYAGIYLDQSDYNNISGNIVTNNLYDGIDIYYSSNNAISGNSITANEFDGVYLFSSSDNTFTGNTLTSNGNGISSYYSSNDRIYHNNFVNNTSQVYLLDSAEIWQDINNCEGNYWKNYNGADLNGDGVGDTYLPWEGIDSYPLMNPYRNIADVNHDKKVDLKDIYATGKAFGSTPGSARWNPHCDITQDLKVDLKDYWIVTKSFGR